VLEALGQKPTDTEIETMIREVVADGSKNSKNSINFDDFLTLMTHPDRALAQVLAHRMYGVCTQRCLQTATNGVFADRNDLLSHLRNISATAYSRISEMTYSRNSATTYPRVSTGVCRPHGCSQCRGWSQHSHSQEVALDGSRA